VKQLLLDLAAVECRLASFALAGGDNRGGAALLSRAIWLLRLRDASRGLVDAPDAVPR
jgi:hypothetical protein